MRKKIVFFIQTRKPIGGSQILFLDLASYISHNYPEYETFYINYSNPNVELLYKNSNINFIDIEKCDYGQFEDAIFFTPINYVFYLINKIQKLKKARICLYFYHPQIFDWLGMQVHNKRVNYSSFFNLLKSTNSCCFMDSSNYISANRLHSANFKEIYVPVTLHEKNHNPFEKPDIIDNNTINIGWLGRLDRDKIFSIINLADNLMDLGLDRKIDIHLIGDGNSKHLIKINNYSPQIRFIFTSYMYGDKRNDYIKNNIDVMLAMGISALDSAIQGIPTIVPIVSPEKFRSNKFVYLFDIKNYSLGWDISDLKEIGCKYHKIEEILEDVYDRQLKTELGEKCYYFAINEFSIENGASKFIEAIENSTLTVEKALKCSLIRKQIRNFKIYRAIRKRKDFESFHEFNARVKRIHFESGLRNKFRRLRNEINKTFGHGKKK